MDSQALVRSRSSSLGTNQSHDEASSSQSVDELRERLCNATTSDARRQAAHACAAKAAQLQPGVLAQLLSELPAEVPLLPLCADIAGALAEHNVSKSAPWTALLTSIDRAKDNDPTLMSQALALRAQCATHLAALDIRDGVLWEHVVDMDVGAPPAALRMAGAQLAAALSQLGIEDPALWKALLATMATAPSAEPPPMVEIAACLRDVDVRCADAWAALLQLPAHPSLRPGTVASQVLWPALSMNFLDDNALAGLLRKCGTKPLLDVLTSATGEATSWSRFFDAVARQNGLAEAASLLKNQVAGTAVQAFLKVADREAALGQLQLGPVFGNCISSMSTWLASGGECAQLVTALAGTLATQTRARGLADVLDLIHNLRRAYQGSPIAILVADKVLETEASWQPADMTRLFKLMLELDMPASAWQRLFERGTAGWEASQLAEMIQAAQVPLGAKQTSTTAAYCDVLAARTVALDTTAAQQVWAALRKLPTGHAAWTIVLAPLLQVAHERARATGLDALVTLANKCAPLDWNGKAAVFSDMLDLARRQEASAEVMTAALDALLSWPAAPAELWASLPTWVASPDPSVLRGHYEKICAYLKSRSDVAQQCRATFVELIDKVIAATQSQGYRALMDLALRMKRDGVDHTRIALAINLALQAPGGQDRAALIPMIELLAQLRPAAAHDALIDCLQASLTLPPGDLLTVFKILGERMGATPPSDADIAALRQQIADLLVAAATTFTQVNFLTLVSCLTGLDMQRAADVLQLGIETHGLLSLPDTVSYLLGLPEVAALHLWRAVIASTAARGDAALAALYLQAAPSLHSRARTGASVRAEFLRALEEALTASAESPAGMLVAQAVVLHSKGNTEAAVGAMSRAADCAFGIAELTSIANTLKQLGPKLGQAPWAAVLRAALSQTESEPVLNLYPIINEAAWNPPLGDAFAQDMARLGERALAQVQASQRVSDLLTFIGTLNPRNGPLALAALQAAVSMLQAHPNDRSALLLLEYARRLQVPADTPAIRDLVAALSDAVVPLAIEQVAQMHPAASDPVFVASMIRRALSTAAAGKMSTLQEMLQLLSPLARNAGRTDANPEVDSLLQKVCGRIAALAADLRGTALMGIVHVLDKADSAHAIDMVLNGVNSGRLSEAELFELLGQLGPDNRTLAIGVIDLLLDRMKEGDEAHGIKLLRSARRLQLPLDASWLDKLIDAMAASSMPAVVGQLTEQLRDDRSIGGPILVSLDALAKALNKVIDTDRPLVAGSLATSGAFKRHEPFKRKGADALFKAVCWIVLGQREMQVSAAMRRLGPWHGCQIVVNIACSQMYSYTSAFEGMVRNAMTGSSLRLDDIEALRSYRSEVRKALPNINWDMVWHPGSDAPTKTFQVGFPTTFTSARTSFAQALANLSQRLVVMTQKAHNDNVAPDAPLRLQLKKASESLLAIARLLAGDSKKTRFLNQAMRVLLEPADEQGLELLLKNAIPLGNAVSKLAQALTPLLDTFPDLEGASPGTSVASAWKSLEDHLSTTHFKTAAAARGRYTTSLINPDDVKNLILGYEVSCCVAPDGAHPEAIVERLAGGWVVWTVKNAKGDTVAAAWGAPSADNELIIDFIDEHQALRDTEAGSEAVKALIDFATPLAAKLGAQGVKVGPPRHRRLDHLSIFKDRKVELQTLSLGAPPLMGNRQYTDALNKSSEYFRPE